MSQKFEPIHPLAMAKALEEINALCGAVIMQAATAKDLAPSANEAQLRTLIDKTATAAEKLRAGLWGDDG